MDYLISALNGLYTTLSRRSKTAIFMVIDLFIFATSIYLAFSLRFGQTFPLDFFRTYWHLTIPFIALKSVFFFLIGMYSPVLRYAGLELFFTTLKSIVLSLGFFVLTTFFFQLTPAPRSILIIDALFTLLLVLSARLIVHSLVNYLQLPQHKGQQQRKVIIYGAGTAGSELAGALQRGSDYRVVAFVDANLNLKNRIIRGIKVFPPGNLAALVKSHGVQDILLAIPSLTKDKLRAIINEVSSLKVRVKTVPTMHEIISNKARIDSLRNIDITDLLGRKEAAVDFELLNKNIKGKTVMVTGAGGSIGSELCRQIAQYDPVCLILYNRNEFILYTIDSALRKEYPRLKIIPWLGSVTDKANVEALFSQYHINTLYHAAAYKHVPLVESNVQQGIENNTFGTLTIAQAAMKYGVETCVLISTDKTVRPTSVMGVSKRIAELIVRAFAALPGHATKFVVVRFGNVMDSAGSVIPRFREQISEGQAVTITHPEVTRYFMSIREAACLVIQAGALGKGGEVFLLEMGKPIKIYDLALQMIKLSGNVPGEDIKLEITGLRPGEKLHEELYIDKSAARVHRKIYQAKEDMLSWEKLEPLLRDLHNKITTNDRSAIIAALKTIVPDYTPYAQQ